MQTKMIVMFFETIDRAERAFNALDALETAGEGFAIDSAVLIQKDEAGKAVVLRKETESLRGTVIGAATGALLGALGGPVGAALGLTAGALAEGAERAVKDIVEHRFVHSVDSALTAGKLALVIEAKEATPYAVDEIIQENATSAFRRNIFFEPRGTGVD